MIVRTYTRRPRLAGDDGDGAAATTTSSSLSPSPSSSPLDDYNPFSQDSQDRSFLAPFSSQDSFLFDSDPFGFGGSLQIEDKKKKGVKDGKSKRVDFDGLERARSEEKEAVTASTSTLMEAQEFGEMMEHVDEVNFALDGLRPGQPVRVRRGSLLSLLSICSNLQQRRLLRAQGMAKKIVDAILRLSIDDSPSTIAVSALLYVLASDGLDDHLLDSPSCVRFLIKLLNPSVPDATEGKALVISSRLSGLCKRNTGASNDIHKNSDYSSRAIISKVRNILLNSKEIKQHDGDEDGTERPELSSKWIVLLTMEKSCLSAVSFEDSSGTIRKVGGNFKEKLREYGGLNEIFNIASGCHSNIEGWLENGVPSDWPLKDGLALQSIIMLLRCLKIMENATFLSKDNQSHLLDMSAKLKKGMALSFVGLILSTIKNLSGLSLHHKSSSSTMNKKPKELASAVSCASEIQVKESCKESNTSSVSSDAAGFSGSQQTCNSENVEASQKHLRLSLSRPRLSLPAPKASQSKGICTAQGSRKGILGNLIGGFASGDNRSHMTVSKGSRVFVNSTVAKAGNLQHLNESKLKITVLGKRTHPPEYTNDCTEGYYDPFAFDEDDLMPSKWDVVEDKKKPRKTQTKGLEEQHQWQIKNKEIEDGLEHMKSNGSSQEVGAHDYLPSSLENPTLSLIDEHCDLLEECLLTAIKVLMNLTNDNPIGCQQIAACGGLDTLASLIITHFPSFNLSSILNTQLEHQKSYVKQCDIENHTIKHLNDQELNFLVAILGLLVNLVEKDSQNRSKLVSARVRVTRSGSSEGKESQRDVIPLLCSIFLANQGAGESAGEVRLSYDDEASLLQGEQEAEMMIIEAYSALLLAFLSTESKNARESIASCLPNHDLKTLVPVLERFVEFHLSLNMISPETHSTVSEVIEYCRVP